MAEHTKIQWTDHTANLWWGCAEVHAGCDHCYARTFARAKGKAAAWEGARFATVSVWKELSKWQAAAEAAGRLDKVFVGSMFDVFEKPMRLVTWQGMDTGVTTTAPRLRFFHDVVRLSPNLLFQLLTKRPGNVPIYAPDSWLRAWPANVITGCSISDQRTAETLLPIHVKNPGPLFVSLEPMIGPVDLRPWLPSLAWVIVGGESGPGARPCDVLWILAVVRQCKAAGVPCFVKQVGANPGTWFAPGPAPGSITLDTYDMPGGEPDDEWIPADVKDPHGGDPGEWPEELRVREFPAVAGPSPATRSAPAQAALLDTAGRRPGAYG